MSFLPIHALRRSVADDAVALFVVCTDDAGKWFDRCEPLLARAFDYAQGRLHPADVRERLSSGWMHLFLVTEQPSNRVMAAVVTEFVQHPQGKALNLAMVGGFDAHRWIDRLFEIERWAKAEGCRWIELSGRPGWERVLGRLHYAPIHTTLGKELA